MHYLGLQRLGRGDDDLSRLPDGPQDRPRLEHAISYDSQDFPNHPLYTGNPWFLPVVGGYYRLRDNLDRLLA